MTEDIIKREEQFVDQFAALKVVDQKSLTMANTAAAWGKEIIKGIKAKFAPHKERARVALEGLREDERQEIGKIEPIIKRLDDEIGAYVLAEREKIRRAEEEQRQAQEERRRLEEETLRKAQEAQDRARHEREEAEARARAAEARAASEKNAAARKKAEEEAARIRRDAELQKREADRRAREEGDKALAEAAVRESAMAPVPSVPRAPIMVNQTMRDQWSAEVFDLMALIRGAAKDGDLFSSSLQMKVLVPNMPFLNEMAEKFHDQMEIPGVRFVNNPIAVKLPSRRTA